MPLPDHFHPPLYPQRAWESFHSRWANAIADALNGVLPERFFAEVQLHLGSQVEADVAEFESRAEPPNGATGGVGLLTWAPPTATWVMPTVFPDEYEVQVRDQRDGARLVAAVELVSPRNKDRAESRRGFAAKCAAYLQRGIGLIVADVVTGRKFNLHNELVKLLALGDSFLMPEQETLYAVAYRPTRREEANCIDTWTVCLKLGESLPQLPLALRGHSLIPVALEQTYQEARAHSRL
jgi:hypothetical protein